MSNTQSPTDHVEHLYKIFWILLILLLGLLFLLAALTIQAKDSKISIYVGQDTVVAPCEKDEFPVIKQVQ